MLGGSKDNNTSTYEKRMRTHSSVAVEVDRAGSGTQLQLAAKTVKKQKDTRNEKLNKIKSRCTSQYLHCWLCILVNKYRGIACARLTILSNQKSAIF